MLTRGRARGGIPRLRHEQVVEKFVDYHFGRLSPEMNTAIERHVRSCARCKREGLGNAANERKGSARQLRSVRGGKPLLGRRARNWALLLTIVLVMQVVIYQIANGHAGAFIAVLSQRGANNDAPINGDQTPPVHLNSASALPLVTSGATAIALSPDDQRLAVAGGDGQRTISIWDIATQKIVVTLAWSDPTAPSSIAWSADGSQLAAADGGQVGVWDAASGASLWLVGVPSAPAMRVYDVSQQVVVGRPDPASAFTGGALAWGPDGALVAAPAGALGPVGVSTPQSPAVGMWSSAGSHIFAGSHGAALVGASAADTQRGLALLDWAPGGRYLLWGMLSRGVAIAEGQSAAGLSRPPDSVVGQLAARIAKAGGANDALVWFAPVGKWVAICDKSQAGAHVEIVAIATGHVSYQLDETCDGLATHSALWSSTGKSFYAIPTKGPIVVFTIGA